MKKLLIVFLIAAMAACGHGDTDGGVTPDSSNIITDSAAFKNRDTTSVLGANHIGAGHLRTDTPLRGSNVGK